jgi:hypothetical protein
MIKVVACGHIILGVMIETKGIMRNVPVETNVFLNVIRRIAFIDVFKPVYLFHDVLVFHVVLDVVDHMRDFVVLI